MDYVIVCVRRMMDVRILRGESGGMSDHYVVERKLGVWCDVDEK